MKYYAMSKCVFSDNSRQYLPGCETRGAHQVTARLDLDVFVVLSTDLAELEG